MAVRVQGLTHVYHPGTPQAVAALRGVDLHVPPGTFLAVIGPVGSGKSTFLQHLNGLLLPQEGRVHVLGVDVGRASPGELRALRRRVGLVFQYPEHQLFAETVADDVAFGPRNMGLDAAEVDERVQAALEAVDLPPSMASRSPFTLSGGERRRAAIAGVLAMDPDVLVMDEPAAGLDPGGRRAVVELLSRLHRRGKTVIVATHDMAMAAERADAVAVFSRGRLVMHGPPRSVFGQAPRLVEAGLAVPQVTQVLLELRNRGWPVRTDRLTVDEAADEIVSRGGCPPD